MVLKIKSVQEFYAAQGFTFGQVFGNVKLSYAASTFFGIPNSKGSYYPEFNINYDTAMHGVTLNGHVGMQNYVGMVPIQNGGDYATYFSGTQIPNGTSNASIYSYVDWRVGVTLDLGSGLIGSALFSNTNAKNFGSNGYAYSSPQGVNLGKGQVILGLSKNF